MKNIIYTGLVCIVILVVFTGARGRTFLKKMNWDLFFYARNGVVEKVISHSKREVLAKITNPISQKEMRFYGFSKNRKAAFETEDDQGVRFILVMSFDNTVLNKLRVPDKNKCYKIMFSNKGDKISVSYVYGGCGIWDLEDETYHGISEELSARCADWNQNDTKIVFSHLKEKHIYIYDLNTLKLQSILYEKPKKGSYIDFASPLFLNEDEIIFFAMIEFKIYKMNLLDKKVTEFYDGKKRGLFQFYKSEILGIDCITPDGKYLLCTRDSWESQNIIALDLETKKNYSLYLGGYGYFKAIPKYSKDGEEER